MKLVKNNLMYNDCTIALKDSEFLYLNTRLSKCTSVRHVENCLKEFYLKSDIRYYKIKHIKEIAGNIIKEVGRNYQSVNQYIDKNKAVSDIIDYPLCVDICANSGKHIIKIKEKLYYFNSNEEAQIYLEKIKVKNL